MGNIIAFSGTHGTGKTTSVYSKANELKMNNLKKSVGILLEVARRCPFAILSKNNDDKSSKEAQLWIFSEQITTELMMSKVYDIVVSDRSIMDIIAYTIVLGYKSLADAMLRIADEHIHIYKEIYFKSLEKNDYLEDDGLRHLDKDLRVQIEKQMLELYHYMSDNFEGKIYY